MQFEKSVLGSVCLTIVLGGALFSSVGCQAWHSSTAIPGMQLKKGDRQIVRDAKNDPFPSPSEVGMKMEQ